MKWGVVLDIGEKVMKDAVREAVANQRDGQRATVGGVDGKLGLRSSWNDLLRTVSVAQGVNQAVDQRDGLKAQAQAGKASTERAGVVERDHCLAHAVAELGLVREVEQVA